MSDTVKRLPWISLRRWYARVREAQGRACLEQCSHCWLDVLIEAEEVSRIVLVLQRDQPFIRCWTVGCFDPIFSLRAQVVDIDSLAFKWLHRLPEVPRPLDILFG